MAVPSWAGKGMFSKPPMGEDGKDKLNKPGAKEASSTQTGNNEQKPYVTKHPAFGTLGQKTQQH